MMYHVCYCVFSFIFHLEDTIEIETNDSSVIVNNISLLFIWHYIKKSTMRIGCKLDLTT